MIKQLNNITYVSYFPNRKDKNNSKTIDKKLFDVNIAYTEKEFLRYTEADMIFIFNDKLTNKIIQKIKRLNAPLVFISNKMPKIDLPYSWIDPKDNMNYEVIIPIIRNLRYKSLGEIDFIKLKECLKDMSQAIFYKNYFDTFSEMKKVLKDELINVRRVYISLIVGEKINITGLNELLKEYPQIKFTYDFKKNNLWDNEQIEFNMIKSKQYSKNEIIFNHISSYLTYYDFFDEVLYFIFKQKLNELNPFDFYCYNAYDDGWWNETQQKAVTKVLQSYYGNNIKWIHKYIDKEKEVGDLIIVINNKEHKFPFNFEGTLNDYITNCLAI
jgi:hypothetical protein